MIYKWNCPKCNAEREYHTKGSFTRAKRTNACRISNRLRPYEGLYNVFVSKNEARYPVQMTFEEFVSFTKINKCHYCGDPVTWLKHMSGKLGRRYRCNLDRTDNQIGYTKDNCVVCCGI